MPGMATHILGGTMYYSSLGNDNYQITLVLYRDCGPGNTNNTALDNPAPIGIYNSNGTLVQTTQFYLPGEVTMPVVVDNPCLSAPPDICTKMGTYTGTVHLPAGNGDYTVAYQRCCRSPGVVNLMNAGEQGMTCTVTIPDPAAHGPNSSPTFDHDPPMVLCLGQTTVLEQSATDADGDSLVYALCSPLQGGDNFLNIAPNPPFPPPYDAVIWGGGYSEQDQVNSTPAMTYNSVTGDLTVHPSMLGNFSVGMCVSEYRDGVLLGTITRDFRFLVVACEQGIISSFAEQGDLCNGLTVQMENQSAGADSYHWDFGVPGTDSDTSNAVNPSFTYTSAGSYTISLIANPDWPCADTSTQVFTVQEPLEISFTPPPILCLDQLPVELLAEGNFTNDASLEWDVGTGVSPDPYGVTVVVGWSQLGGHAVTVQVEENGCTASHTDSVVIHPPPEPAFTVDAAGCAPASPVFINNSTAWAPMEYLWDFGDGTTSTDSLPVHEFTAPGHYTISLTATTTQGCIASRTVAVSDALEVWPKPVARFSALPTTTSIMAPEITFTDHSIGANQLDFLVEGIHYHDSTFTHRYSDAGWYQPLLTVTNSYGCTDTISQRIAIDDHLFFAPNAFTPNGDGDNEVWAPSVLGARLYTLEIYDRWGHLVFWTNDPNEGWDGAGHMQGTYTYRARLSEWGVLDVEYTGSFSLLR